MKYIKLVMQVDQKYQDILIAELADLEFEEFQQTNDELITYIPAERFHVGDRDRIEHLLATYQGKGFVKSEEVVQDQNWNETWEKTIKAQSIGPFLVKPTWSARMVEPDQILLEIDPKMAFGTGYHETTRLMLRRLPKIINKSDNVLDAGTGSGILAIAAAKLGADHVLAFDIDEWSIQNANENILLNDVDHQVTIKQGTHKIIDAEQYFNVILANIQQNVITEMLPLLALQLKDSGTILLSGLLKDDESKIRNQLKKNGLEYINTTQENEWIAIWAKKKK